MEGRLIHFLLIFLLSANLCSGLRITHKEALKKTSKTQHHEVQQNGPISTTQRDITTPLPTVPTITPAPPAAETTPVIIPNSNPDSASPSVTMNPITTTPTTTTTPVSPGVSWCVASQGASQKALQIALDFACGHGGADCSAIQPSGSCYYPNSIRDHASYAFNSYYQRNPVPNSCNFGGTAVITSTNPSTGNCQYPSTSTSTSILNTTNSSGSTVYGSVPSGPPSSSSASKISSSSIRQVLFTLTCLFLLFALI